MGGESDFSQSTYTQDSSALAQYGYSHTYAGSVNSSQKSTQFSTKSLRHISPTKMIKPKLTVDPPFPLDWKVDRLRPSPRVKGVDLPLPRQRNSFGSPEGDEMEENSGTDDMKTPGGKFLTNRGGTVRGIGLTPARSETAGQSLESSPVDYSEALSPSNIISILQALSSLPVYPSQKNVPITMPTTVTSSQRSTPRNSMRVPSTKEIESEIDYNGLVPPSQLIPQMERRASLSLSGPVYPPIDTATPLGTPVRNRSRSNSTSTQNSTNPTPVPTNSNSISNPTSPVSPISTSSPMKNSLSRAQKSLPLSTPDTPMEATDSTPVVKK